MYLREFNIANANWVNLWIIYPYLPVKNHGGFPWLSVKWPWDIKRILDMRWVKGSDLVPGHQLTNGRPTARVGNKWFGRWFPFCKMRPPQQQWQQQRRPAMHVVNALRVPDFLIHFGQTTTFSISCCILCFILNCMTQWFSIKLLNLAIHP